MVYTLEKLGYIRKHPVTRRYQLTPHVMRIGFNYLAADTLIDVANPFLSELTNLTGETTNLTEPDEDEMVYVARFVSTKFVPIHMPIGSRIPMYCTGSGRAFLSARARRRARASRRHGASAAHAAHGHGARRTRRAARQRAARRLCHQPGAVHRRHVDCRARARQPGQPVAAVHVVAPTSRWTFDDARRKLAPA